MDYRIEKDTLGEVKVPKDSLWGAQTERSKKNFKIGNPSSMPIEIIHAYAILKKSAAVELAANAVVTGTVHYNLIEMVMGAQVNGSLVHGGDGVQEAMITKKMVGDDT